jgi:hypothetical protein
MKNLSIVLSLVLFAPSVSFAWGRRGHQIVAETAIYLNSANDTGLRWHSFDIGYYANVPDFFWKKPSNYDTEKPQHFMDMELFDREFAKRPEIKKPFELSRKEFEAKFPDIKPMAGRAFWRIREMSAQLGKIADQLRAIPEEGQQKERQALQLKWLLMAGTLGHYVGDLSQPLHVTENYDGGMTGQKGVHSFFEDICVDQAYPHVQDKVNTLAQKQWPAFKKKNADKSVLDMITVLAEGSKKDLPILLAIDKKTKRDEVAKTCAKYEQMIVNRITESTLILAEIYRRNLGWKFDNDKFFLFAGEPEYIKPGEPEAESAVASKQ